MESKKLIEDELNGDSLKGREIKTTLVLTAAFFVNFMAFKSLQGLQSTLNEKHDLGVISLSVVYGSCIFFGLFAPAAIQLFGARKCMMVNLLCHIIYTSSNFYPSFYTLIPSSALLGGTTGFLWTSQSIYITASAYSLAASRQETPYVTLSKLNGIFFTFNDLSQVPGNLISSFLLDTPNSTRREQFCGFNKCPTSLLGTKVSQPDPYFVKILLGVFVTFNMAALLIVYCGLSPLPKNSMSGSPSKIKDTFTSMFVVMFTTKLPFILPLVTSQTLTTAFLNGDYTQSYVSCPLGVHMVGYVMAAYGGTKCISVVIFSRLAKYTGRYILFGLLLVIHIGFLLTLYVWVPSPNQAPWIFLLVIACSIADGIYQTQFNALVGLFFRERATPAFATVHTWSSIGSATMYGLSSLLCVRTKLIIMFTLLSLSIVSYIGVEIYVYLVSTKEDESNQNSE